MIIDIMVDKGAFIPTRAHKTDAGYDLCTPKCIEIPPRSSLKIDTGVHMMIPSGYVGMLKSKSGLNVNKGILSEGVIDAGYTGSIVAKLYNHSDEIVRFNRGDKITQIVIMPLASIEILNLVDKFEQTERGNNGFGSTGK